MEVLHCNLVHAPSFGNLEVLENVYIGIEKGIIIFIEKDKNLVLSRYAIQEVDIVDFYEKSNRKFIVPGFIDLHVHSAQYAYLGTGTDIPLMKWLNEYAFPSERKTITDQAYTQHVYEKLVQRLIANGVTTTLYFTTIDVDSSLLLANIVRTYGVRGLIGKVCQDQHSPANYCERTTQSLQETERFIKGVLSLNSDLVSPVITPRFIPNCSTNLLRGLGELYKKYKDANIYVQSHITESLDEIEFVHQLYHDTNISDAQIFDKYHLLNEKCIMVHAVHCSEVDWKLLASKGVSIAHCPLSNAFFAHGNLDIFGLIQKYNLNVGLGTDIAGGYSSSMLQCMRQTVITNRMIHQYDTENYMDYKHALYLATYGGAKCLQMHDKIGLFKVGMQFDAVLLDADSNGNIDIFEHDNTHTIFEKLMNLGDDRNISQVWVKGKPISQVKRQQYGTSKL